MGSQSSGQFVFEKHDIIGAADADDDKTFLHECFEDTGDLSIIRDITKPQRIIVGRTGSGKTALLRSLERDQGNRAVFLNPEHLAIKYITENPSLRQMRDQGAVLAPFFKLLWRHIFVVEAVSKPS